MTTPSPVPTSVLITRSEARNLPDAPSGRCRAVHGVRLARRLAGVSAEAGRTTPYLLRRDHLTGARAVHTVLNRWRGTDATAPAQLLERPS